MIARIDAKTPHPAFSAGAELQQRAGADFEPKRKVDASKTHLPLHFHPSHANPTPNAYLCGRELSYC